MLVDQVAPNNLGSTRGGFILHLLLMASWGFWTVLSWNAPAWSVSSEWLADLVRERSRSDGRALGFVADKVA